MPVFLPFFRHSAKPKPTAVFTPSKRTTAKRDICNIIIDHDIYQRDNVVYADGSDGNSDKGVSENVEHIEVSVDLPDVSDDDRNSGEHNSNAEDTEVSDNASDISCGDSIDDDDDDNFVYDDDDDDDNDSDKSEDDISLGRPSTKRKRVGEDLQDLFEWEDGDFEPEEIIFDSTKAGIQRKYHELANIIDFVKTFMCEELIELMVIESNRYYQQIVQTKKSPYSRLRQWRETDVNEMYTFLAVYMLMVRNQKVSVSEYWSTDRLLCSPIFHEIISKNRFDLLMSMLHFCNNEKQPENDKLFKIA
jgi:hypothetical protein